VGKWGPSALLLYGTVILVLILGNPANLEAYCAIAFGFLLVIALSVLILRKSRLRWIVMGVFFVYAAWLAFPLDSSNFTDLCNGRTAVGVHPGGLLFARNGPNTRLIQKYFGERQAKWIWKNTRFHLLGKVWGEGDRVDWKSVVFQSYLPEALSMLPSDEARTQVLGCVTDSGNLIRVHQGLLLACLKTFGYPKGYDSRTWWDEHKWVFVVERDPLTAARMVWGWLDATYVLAPQRPTPKAAWALQDIRTQQYAVESQQNWGTTNFSFAGAYSALERDEGLRAQAPGVTQRVVWWPELRDERQRPHGQ